MYVCLSVCMSVCMSALNLRGLQSHDNETWHVGPLSDLDVHGPSGIRKSKSHIAHAIPRHLEVLHAKFHDRATSNLRD